MFGGCDTFVVLPPLTKSGRIIFGKNSDRPGDEVQEVVYFPKKTVLEKNFKCTYIEVEEICENTFAVVLTKPTWLWGAEMGSNSAGVVIGNEAIFTQEPEPSTKEGLLGMDLVRLGLERGGTAKESMGIITKYLETYGQGGPCTLTKPPYYYNNSFIIADPEEAWVLETVGKQWAAENISCGFRNISNTLSITTKIDKMSSGLKEFAIKEKLWDGQEEFNFKKVFVSDTCWREAEGCRLVKEASDNGSFEVEDMFSVLRDRESGINMGIGKSGYSATTASQVSLLSSTTCIHWLTGTPDPCLSLFKPFFFTSNVNMPSQTISIEKQNPLLYTLHSKIFRNRSTSLEEISEMETVSTQQMLSYLNEPIESRQMVDVFKNIVEKEIQLYESLKI